MGLENLDVSSTIFGVASGSLPSAVAIIKLSGARAFEIANKIFQVRGKGATRIPHERGMWVGTVADPCGDLIDEALVLSFKAPHSFTGEDVIEFQLHGSVSIVRRCEELLLSLGAEPAGKGAFSYRAYLNGKLTLAELDNLADIFASTRPQDLRPIYSRRDGALEKKIGSLRSYLLSLQAILDTAVDFSEEYSAVVDQAGPVILRITHECSEIIQRYSHFRLHFTDPRLVIAGRPNAGKSSLFNALLCRYRAIVHDEAGTTRDIIEESVQVGEATWRLVDTAGIRTASGPEQIGISLAEDYLSSCSYWVLVVDGEIGLGTQEAELLERFKFIPHLIVWNKADSARFSPPIVGSKESVVAVSALDGNGVNALWSKLKEELRNVSFQSVDVIPTATQCTRLQKVLDRLLELSSEAKTGTPPEYLAEKCRSLSALMAEVVGEISVEDVLSRVFNEFCIGK